MYLVLAPAPAPEPPPPCGHGPEYVIHAARAPDSNAPASLFTIVTALTANHFEEARQLFVSRAKHSAETPIVLWDLGLTEAQRSEASTWCDVEIRRFAFECYPAHVRELLRVAHAWKPIIIERMMQERGNVFWADASIRFVQPLPQATIDKWRTLGVVGRRASGPLSAYTHEGTFRYLHLDVADYHTTPVIASGLVLLLDRPDVRQNIVSPWVQCALTKECIWPDGARHSPCEPVELKHHYRNCHRDDQSILSILLAQHLPSSFYDTDFERTFAIVRKFDAQQPEHYNTSSLHECHRSPTPRGEHGASA